MVTDCLSVHLSHRQLSPVANLDFGVLIGFMLVIMIMKMMMNMMSDMNKPVRQQKQIRMAPQKALIA